MSLDVTLKLNGDEVYSANITHNLNVMAKEAGIYKELWRPEEVGATHARQLIEPLKAGLCKMVSDPVLYESLNSPNGWGTYENFLPWVVEYLKACMLNPDAIIEVDR